MSKNMNKLVLLSALMIAIIGTFGTVSAEETVDLIAGGNQVIGNVTVTNDTTNIYVTYTTIDGWLLNETHLQVAEEIADIPQTKKGNPKVGKFDNSNIHDPCVTQVEYTILNDYTTGDVVIIAAHAAVDGPTTYESAWGNGTEFAEDRNWAMYFTYTIA